MSLLGISLEGFRDYAGANMIEGFGYKQLSAFILEMH